MRQLRRLVRLPERAKLLGRLDPPGLQELPGLRDLAELPGTSGGGEGEAPPSAAEQS